MFEINDYHLSPPCNRNYISSWAKDLKRRLSVPHSIALEIIANYSGYSKWQSFQKTGFLSLREHLYFHPRTLDGLADEINAWFLAHAKSSKLLDDYIVSRYRTPFNLIVTGRLDRLSHDELAFISEIIRDNTEKPILVSPRVFDYMLVRTDSSLSTALTFMTSHNIDTLSFHMYDHRAGIRLYNRINWVDGEFLIQSPELDSLSEISSRRLIKHNWFDDFIVGYINDIVVSLKNSQHKGQITFYKVVNQQIHINRDIRNINKIERISSKLAARGGKAISDRYAIPPKVGITFDF